MSLDSRLRDELRRAVDADDPRTEDALREIRAMQPGWADLTVVALGAPDAPRAGRVRTRRLVGALAACALFAGAVTLPVALRSRPRAARPAGDSVSSSTCGSPVTTGYRSTAVVRVAAARAASTPSTTPDIELSEPAQFALGLCDTARAAAHLRSGPGIGFAAKTNAAADLLALTVFAPTPSGTDALARSWASGFAVARRAEALRAVREQQRRLEARVERLHRELRGVDTKLARLMPVVYGNVLKFDGPNGGDAGEPPPSVPERGSVKALNLAFERIQLLAELNKAGKTDASLRIAAIRPVVYASVVSQSPATLVHPPHHRTNTSTVLLAVGLLIGGALLAGAAFWLGRRGRRMRGPEPSAI